MTKEQKNEETKQRLQKKGKKKVTKWQAVHTS